MYFLLYMYESNMCIDCLKYSDSTDLSQLFLLKNPLVINLRSKN